MVCLYCFPKASCENLVASDVWKREMNRETENFRHQRDYKYIIYSKADTIIQSICLINNIHTT